MEPVNHLASADWKREAQIATVMSLFDDMNHTITRASIAAATGLGVSDVVELEKTMCKRGFLREAGKEKFERAAVLATLDHTRFDRRRLEPQTAREALLEIRRLFAGGTICDDMLGLLNEIDGIAEAGLARRDAMNFELIDLLADRLAESHAVLRKVDREGFPDDSALEGEVSEALALSPDLESMVERRIGGRS